MPAPSQLHTAIAAMHTMVAKYGADFPSRPENMFDPPSGDIVFVTGTTGSLGCYLLEALATDPSIARVYAFNRPSKKGVSLSERQNSELGDRGIDTRILRLKKVVLLEGDLTKPAWGLPVHVYEELHRSVTHIIHNAWRVNLVSPLSIFEPNIKGLRFPRALYMAGVFRYRIALILAYRARLFPDAPPEEVVLETPLPPSYAAGRGYCQSKWIAEEILHAAAKVTAIDPLIVRVGTICAGPSGVWNPIDWVPAMVLSSSDLGCLPDEERVNNSSLSHVYRNNTTDADSQSVDWVQFDVAARALVELRGASNNTRTMHVVHPRPALWRTIVAVLAQELALPIVPLKQWLALNQPSGSSAPAQSTSEKLAIVRAARTANSAMAFGWSGMDTARACEASSTMADPHIRKVGVEDVKQWVAYWRRIGFLKPAAEQSSLARL
ncbi:uncharacterized protein FIBRA_01886 [Fibroporia radiculosa]|uniref:Thioester reductase (TE) domain-containing protein n=1 Tax=Fibroporia radiculosa TaxID=599839 RepID=J4I8R3_9APHY|nr:uncharacterized protein FIBRA_01886 [Fibroporia radiculosa]CCL99861.1 predicted protein [Fibroporia radiculosa]